MNVTTTISNINDNEKNNVLCESVIKNIKENYKNLPDCTLIYYSDFINSMDFYFALNLCKIESRYNKLWIYIGLEYLKKIEHLFTSHSTIAAGHVFKNWYNGHTINEEILAIRDSLEYSFCKFQSKFQNLPDETNIEISDEAKHISFQSYIHHSLKLTCMTDPGDFLAQTAWSVKCILLEENSSFDVNEFTNWQREVFIKSLRLYENNELPEKIK